ncbi:MAG TPA: hypothetical protein G4O07_09155, partial [Dehalococcoidia bacterium]|nr:hypothetical protein [Dehalococcoidia bacterium]
MDDSTEKILAAQLEPKRHSELTQFFIRLVREKPLGTIGGAIVLILLLVAVFADLIAPFDYQEIHIKDRLEAPGGTY